MNKKTSVFENGLIWFGAAISPAEIMTGTLFASLGMIKGTAAVIVGHLIGCIILYLAGCMGGEMRKTAMDTASISFGSKGNLLFAVLNIVQLAGWTAIMIYDGAAAANGIWNVGSWIWSIAVGVLIIVWILIGVENLGKLNTFSMIALFMLTIILSFTVFGDKMAYSMIGDEISFGAAVELAVAMPLSWVPLISDYTCSAEKPKKSAAVSVFVYFAASCWMYMIGMGAAIFSGTSDIASVMIKAGLGIWALMIIILSTVTTTFLDAYSAGVSSKTIHKKANVKYTAVVVTVIGILAAIIFRISDITDFLYFIGSVFAPMMAIQIADFFILKNDYGHNKFNWRNIAVWVLGFVLYRYTMKFNFVCGNTLICMISIILICIAADKIKDKLKK